MFIYSLPPMIEDVKTVKQLRHQTSAVMPAVSSSSSGPLVARKSKVSSSQRIPAEEFAGKLRERICEIFSNAQNNTAGHRKLVITLQKLQESYADRTDAEGGAVQDPIHHEEGAFASEMARCIIRILAIKKSEAAGDKLIRFVGLFLKHTSEKDAASLPGNEPDIETLDETPSTRLVNNLLRKLTQCFAAKEKTVRYRAIQLTAHIINSVDSIDDDCYHLLRGGLMKRIKDKESMVRVQAVIALGRLAGNEDIDNDNEDSDEEDPAGLVEKLLNILQHDPSPEVRRSLLLNLPLTPVTLPYLLERARDVDIGTRKALYSRLLPSLGDFRHLSLSMREKLLRWGLRDRDENVRKATARLFCNRWIEDCENPPGAPEDAADKASPMRPSLDALLELLERIDIVNSGGENGVGGEAMQMFWDGRPDYQAEMSFQDPFWNSLSPESVYIARTWNDFQQAGPSLDYDEGRDGKMPEVTRVAFCLQQHTERLTELLRRSTRSDDEVEDEEIVEQEFIVEQLLQIAKTLDYADEVGRRKMYSLMRETLAIAELPDIITQLVIETLRDVCGDKISDERDFTAVVLEAIAEVHDTIAIESTAENKDESFHSAQSELSERKVSMDRSLNDANGTPLSETEEQKAIREIMVNMKCLQIAECMLQNVEGTLQSNPHLVTMLNNLIVPAVRSQEAPVREKGLLCLGLCCLLDRSLADENLTLFLHCFSKGHDALQINAIQIVSDILESHPTMLTSQKEDSGLDKAVTKMFSKALKSTQSSEVQAIAAIALCKLLLVNVIEDEDLLKQSVIAFFDPETCNNNTLRQALSYSLPVYCYSKKQNMARMARVAGSVLRALVTLNEEAGDEEDTVDMGNAVSVLVDWTDARKIVTLDGKASWQEDTDNSRDVHTGDPHLTVAESVIERALVHGCSREERKAYFSTLGKLSVSAGQPDEQLERLRSSVIKLMDSKVANEASSRTALNKLYTAVNKAMGDMSGNKIGTLEETVPPAVTEDGSDTIEDIGNGKLKAADSTRLEPDSVLDELLDSVDDIESGMA